jgi:nucleoid-associated protein YgaU
MEGDREDHRGRRRSQALPLKGKRGLELMRLNQITGRLCIAMAAVLLGAFLPTWVRAAENPSASGNAASEFFIVSSVDLSRKQIVLKRPTEVTELIQTSDKTDYRNEEGKEIQFANLRAGDTVWVTFDGKAEGVRVAAVIRKGPMTTDELHRRYVKFD